MESKTVTLPAARYRVARILDLDVAPWSPDEVRWISEQWRIFRFELEQCERLKAEIMELERQARPWWWLAMNELAGGIRWWADDSPPAARAAVGAVAAFVYAFVWGWL